VKKSINRFKYILILIPLGIAIRFIDIQVTEGFLSSNQNKDHFMFIGGLVIIVIALLAAVLYFERKSNS
jgi:uncharacterized membrane protein YidH (DUF202 family)